MARKPAKGEKLRKRPEGKAPQVYKHPKETLLLRPDVGLQPQFKAKKLDPDTPAAIRSAVGELVSPPVADWRGALDRFVTEVQALYGSRLRGVVLYGSRARGDAEPFSDVDTLVLLDQCPDMWDELDRLRDIVHHASLDHGVVLTALPVAADAFERRDSPLLANAHREGVRVA